MKRRPVAGGLLALLFLVLVGLGVWQVERLAWKEDLIARVEARVHAAAVASPAQGDWARINPVRDEYRRVRLTGKFFNDRETLVQAVTERGGGYWVMTPLRVADGSVVLVNRGFVPLDRRDPATRRQGQIAGETTVTGLVRMTEPKGGFLRSNDPVGDRWYSRDVAAIAAKRELANVAPFFVDADATANTGGLPVGGLTVIRFSNNHLVYAITWFVLAGMVAAAAIMIIRRTGE